MRLSAGIALVTEAEDAGLHVAGATGARAGAAAQPGVSDKILWRTDVES